MLKLGRRARGHFVTLIEIRVHLIRVKPGHTSPSQTGNTCFVLMITENFTDEFLRLKSCYQDPWYG